MKECTDSSPVNITLKVIGGKWKPLILWHLRKGPLRFSSLSKVMSGVTQKMLTQQLRDLEQEGLVTRTVFPEIPPRVEYAITPYGQTLEPLLIKMADWGKNHALHRSR